MKDIDCEILVEAVSKKEVLGYLDTYLDNLQHDCFDASAEGFHILYKDGSCDYINEEYDDHKIKRQDIVSLVYDNTYAFMVYGKFEIHECGLVTAAFKEKIANKNILEIK